MRFKNEATIETTPEKLPDVKKTADKDDIIRVKDKVDEGIMSELDILAQEASSVEEFLQNVYTQYPQHEGNMEAENFLVDFYNQRNSLEELGITGEFGGKPTRITGDDFYDLLQAGLKVANSPQAFVNYITFGITDETSQLSPKNQETLKNWYMQNKQMEEGKGKKILTGLALFTALMAGNRAIINSDSKLQDLKAKYEKAEEAGDKEKMKELKDKIAKQEIFLTTGKEDKTLKEVARICYNKGMNRGQVKEVLKRVKSRLNEDHTKNPNDKYTVKKCSKENEPWAVWEGKKRIKGFASKVEAEKYAKKQNKKQNLNEEQYVVKYQVGSDVIDQYKRVEASSEEEAIRKVKREVEDFSKPGANYIARGVDGKDIISATLATPSRMEENEADWRDLDIEWEMLDAEYSRPDFQQGPGIGIGSDNSYWAVDELVYTEFGGYEVESEPYRISKEEYEQS